MNLPGILIAAILLEQGGFLFEIINVVQSYWNPLRVYPCPTNYQI